MSKRPMQPTSGRSAWKPIRPSAASGSAPARSYADDPWIQAAWREADGNRVTKFQFQGLTADPQPTTVPVPATTRPPAPASFAASDQAVSLGSPIKQPRGL